MAKSLEQELGFVPHVEAHASHDDIGFEPHAPDRAEDIPRALEALEPRSSKTYSQSESLLKGLQQGTTLGGADELGGMVQSTADYAQAKLHNLLPSLVGMSPTQVNEKLRAAGITGNIGPTSSKELYRHAQKENSAEYKKASEDNPGTYLGGELAGGVLGFSGAGAATKALGIAPTVAGLEGTGALARASRVGAGALNAAPVGAAAGALSSDSNIVGGNVEDLKNVGKDALTGAATATALGAGIHLAKEAIPAVAGKLGDLAQKTDYGKKLKYYYDLGKKGLSPGNTTDVIGDLSEPESLNSPLSKQTTDAATDLVERYKQGRNFLGEKVTSVLNDATGKGQFLDLTPEFNTSMNQFDKIASQNSVIAESPQFQKIRDSIQKLQRNQLTPLEAQSLRKEVGDLGKKIVQQNPIAGDIAFKFSKDLNSALTNQVAGYGQAAERYSSFLKLFPETILSKDAPTDIARKSVSRIKNSDSQVLNQIRSMMEGLSDNDKAKSSFSNLLQSLQELGKKEGGAVANGEKSVFDAMGLHPEDIQNRIKDAALKSDALKQYTQAPSSVNDLGIVKTPFKIGKSILDIGANKAGKAVSAFGERPGLTAAGEAVGPAVEDTAESWAGGAAAQGSGEERQSNSILSTSQKLYNASDDELSDFTKQLHQIPGQQQLAMSLDRALKEKNTSSKNAILFSIMQNPSLRSVVDSDNLKRFSK